MTCRLLGYQPQETEETEESIEVLLEWYDYIWIGKDESSDNN